MLLVDDRAPLLSLYSVRQLKISAMESLFLPLIILFPVLALAGFYRLWLLLSRQITFKNNIIGIVYVSSLVVVIIGFLYYGWYFFSCVWPNHCGEGFSSGYVAAGVILGVAMTSVLYVISEVILLVARR